MNVHISYKLPKTADIEKDFNRQIEKLRRRLQVFRPELVHLHASIDEPSARHGIVVRLDLRLPSGDIAASALAPSSESSIKGAFEDLIEQLAKHKDRLRGQWQWARKRRVGRTRPQPQVPFEETLAAVKPPTASQDDITSYINTNLVRLSRFVERELRYRESVGDLRQDQLSPEEVVDEAIANALGDGERPDKIALEPWLYRLAMRAIDDLASRSTENVDSVSLDKPMWKQNVRASDEPQLQFHQPDEDFTEASLIADRRVATPEESAASDEMVSQVESALLGAERNDREAFLLFAIEGFTPEEISVISDRTIDQVRQSIRAARDFLRKALPAGNEFRDKLLQHSKIA
jgi:DNA-directed RNA polymerase specialized sigma24 family protein/ribosome-associated translation inhibitor RaiA